MALGLRLAIEVLALPCAERSGLGTSAILYNLFKSHVHRFGKNAFPRQRTLHVTNGIWTSCNDKLFPTPSSPLISPVKHPLPPQKALKPLNQPPNSIPFSSIYSQLPAPLDGKAHAPLTSSKHSLKKFPKTYFSIPYTFPHLLHTHSASPMLLYLRSSSIFLSALPLFPALRLHLRLKTRRLLVSTLYFRHTLDSLSFADDRGYKT